jgi:hypothetical protein
MDNPEATCNRSRKSETMSPNPTGDQSQGGANANAIVVMDKADWHTTSALQVPANLSLLHLPPRSPELNPQENVWQFLRQTYLSNRVFDGYEAIVEACCKAWDALLAEAGRIASIATRTWATISQ